MPAAPEEQTEITARPDGQRLHYGVNGNLKPVDFLINADADTDARQALADLYDGQIVTNIAQAAFSGPEYLNETWKGLERWGTANIRAAGSTYTSMVFAQQIDCQDAEYRHLLLVDNCFHGPRALIEITDNGQKHALATVHRYRRGKWTKQAERRAKKLRQTAIDAMTEIE